MIRKQTWILLAIFIVMVGAAFYLRENPIKTSQNLTPSPTPQLSMLKDWLSSDIIKITYQDDQDKTLGLEQDSQGYWIIQPNGARVDLGKVEEIRTQLVDARVMTTMDPGYDLSGIGLSSPTGILTVTNAAGNKAEIRIGKQTPTGSGYYIEVNQEAPAVVSTGAIETLLGLLTEENLVPTPTSEVTPSPEGAEPSGS